MATHLIQESFNASVVAEESYFLTVVIGNGQAGSTSFQDFQGNFSQPNVVNVAIGTGADIVNKNRKIASVVLEVNPDSNNMIVSYYLTKEEVDKALLRNPVGELTITAEEGDTITFIVTLNFVG